MASVPDPCTILDTATVNNVTLNNLGFGYEPALCTAITDWNTDNPANQIFMGATEQDRRNEMAAFFGHALFETDGFQNIRAKDECNVSNDGGGGHYCQPLCGWRLDYQNKWDICFPFTYYYPRGDYPSRYCDPSLTWTSNPPGCRCQNPVREYPLEYGDFYGGFYASSLYLGRGALMLKYNHNYYAAGEALGLNPSPNQCISPETWKYPRLYWLSAIWIWMESTGEVGTITPHVGVADNGSFGQSMHSINGNYDCDPDSLTSAPYKQIPIWTAEQIVERLNRYCFAVHELGADILTMDGCTDLQTHFDNCTAANTCAYCTSLTSPPTRFPTPPPTPLPTKVPTLPPTPSPAKSPTPAPSPSPTKSPTPAPTSSPTSAPTSPPTKSASPTIAITPPPTSSPSNPPTLQPSISPTTPPPTNPPTTPPPTNPPTNRPTKSPSPFLWYPDWEGANEGCKADGNEPLYMTLQSGTHMYNEQDYCCTSHYGWNYGICMSLDGDGNSLNADTSLAVSSGLYFPAWASSGTCKIDEGDAPNYMRVIGGSWMKETLEECCTSHFGWNYVDCVGADGGANRSAADAMYYPNWKQGKNECINDGNQPVYMTNNPSVYMYETLEDCCDWYFSWAPNSCLVGEGAAASSSGTPKWYVNWREGTHGVCVQDCPESSNSGSLSCGGFAAPWVSRWDSKSECCSSQKSWDDDCLST